MFIAGLIFYFALQNIQYQSIAWKIFTVLDFDYVALIDLSKCTALEISSLHLVRVLFDNALVYDFFKFSVTLFLYDVDESICKQTDQCYDEQLS